MFLVGLWSTVRLVAGPTPIVAAGRGGRWCCHGALGWLPPGSGSKNREAGDRMLHRWQAIACSRTRQRSREGEDTFPVEVSLTLGQGLEGLD